MKTLIILILGVLFTLGAMAQIDTSNMPPPPPPLQPDVPVYNDYNDDTIKIKVGNYKVIVIDNEKKKKDYDTFDIILNEEFDEEDDDHDSYKSWAGFDLGVNGYLNPDNSTKMPSGYEFLEVNYRRSFSFALNLFEKDIPIVHDYVKLATGLGMEWNNYVFMNNIRLSSDSDMIYGYTDTTYNFDKSRLLLTYINLPLLIQINTGIDPKTSFHFSFGAIFSYNVGACTKLKYDINDKTSRLKTRSDYHVNPFRYGLTARLGYGNFKIFANYSLNSLFVKDEGPELYPFSVGICVIPF